MATRRQAKIDALNIAIVVLQEALDDPRMFVSEDGVSPEQVKHYVQKIIEGLEDQRDDAALTEYHVEDRKTRRQEFLELTKQRNTERRKAKAK